MRLICETQPVAVGRADFPYKLEVQGIKRRKVKHVLPPAFLPPRKFRVLSTKPSCPQEVCALTRVASQLHETLKTRNGYRHTMRNGYRHTCQAVCPLAGPGGPCPSSFLLSLADVHPWP